MDQVPPPYITADKIHDILTYDLLVSAVERGLGLFSESHNGKAKVGNDVRNGIVNQPVRSIVQVPSSGGFLGCMPVYVEADELLVTKLVTFFPNNKNVPSHHAVISVFCAKTGVPRALMDGEVITTKRTAAASAVATKYLVNGDPKVLALIGSGVQAGSHYDALTSMFNFEQVRVWSHRPERAQLFASSAQHRHNTVACASVEETVKEADVIVTVTSSKDPVLMAQWVKPGAHINAVGACRPEWAEIDPNLMRSAVVYVDSRDGALKESGDILMAKAEVFAEIGEVINGTTPALKDKTTVFKSLGMAMEDAVAAKVVLDKLGL